MFVKGLNNSSQTNRKTINQNENEKTNFIKNQNSNME
jgi:hypothetical protein